MNVYFLVEGKTEAKLYPRWLKQLAPHLHQVKQYDEISDNNYYLFSAKGYPKILEEDLPNAIAEVNEVDKYDYLVLCFDADEDTIAEREAMVMETLREQGISLIGAELVLIVQNRCIETWFLGNRIFFKRNPEKIKILREYVNFYDVSRDDPELMGNHPAFAEHQQFHKAYFKALCQERKVSYSEKSVTHVAEVSYLEQLQKRVNDTDHLNSLRTLVEFCRRKL